MLLKLIKHEFKNNWSTFAALYFVLLAASFLIRFSSSDALTGIVAFIYSITIFATIIFSLVAIINSFNRSMFKKEGYLTLTLPVNTSSLIASKLIVSSVWFSLSSSIVLLSAFIMIPDATTFFNNVQMMLDYFGATTLISYIFITSIFSIIEFVLCVFLAITIVNTCWIKKYRGFIGVAVYFATNYFIAFIRTLFLPENPFGGEVLINSFGDVQYYISLMNDYLGSTMFISIIFSLFVAVACYIGIRYLLNNKVELD